MLFFYVRILLSMYSSIAAGEYPALIRYSFIARALRIYSLRRITTRPSVYAKVSQSGQTYIHSVGNAVAFLLVVPSLEIVTQTVGTAMHEHTTQVFLFEVLLLSTVA
jgi:hypothetical protein